MKVLDFGLAKALGPTEASSVTPTVTNSPTLSMAATQAGVILGTAAYMAPEQARGKPADKRADIWAFGCLLYEMLTGNRAFEGEDLSETLAFVLTKEPDWNALPAGTPPSVRSLLRRCLERDVRKRVADNVDTALRARRVRRAQRLQLHPGRSRTSGVTTSALKKVAITGGPAGRDGDLRHEHSDDRPSAGLRGGR